MVTYYPNTQYLTLDRNDLVSTQNPARRNDSSAGRAAMGRLVDGAVDDLVDRQSEPLARRLLDRTGQAEKRSGTREQDEASLSTLQEILFGTDRDQIQVLAEDLHALRHRIDDKDALAAAVAPILGDAIRRQIRDSREEIIDALHPIIGQIVVRAVTEAMRDLARSIDERLQAATDFQRMGRRLRSLVTGVPVGELALRSGLPFVVQEVYLIQRESGLLLWHAVRSAEPSADADLVGAMLTAIREFAEQVLGGRGEQLHQLRVGNRELLLEFARYSYVGIVLDGVVPDNFRWKLHQHIFAFEKSVTEHLRDYSGDASTLRQAASREFEPFLSIETDVTR